MSDRALLELAAKAIGYTLEWQITSYTIEKGVTESVEIPYATSNSPDEAPMYWNPIEDDGDAFRLAVKLGLSLHTYPDHHQGAQAAATMTRHAVEAREHAEDNGDDLNAATRRAITRAAAEIQRQRESK